MKIPLAAIAALGTVVVAQQVAAQVVFYEQEGLRGRSFTTNQALDNFDQLGFNDRASSVVVQRGEWEVCEDAHYRGRCVTLRPGQYPSLAAMGMNK